VVTEKGHGFRPAVEDPTAFHAPAPFSRSNGSVSISKSAFTPYTKVARDAILAQMRKDSRVAVITAAMCQGNMLEPIREEFPQRFFDVGICESHAVAFAAGLAKAGMKPIVDIYSTFLQRSYDQIFQEVSLQNLPVVMMMDRGGLAGPDGPTHHGVFDIGCLRAFPNLTVMAPGDQSDLREMLAFALASAGPTAIRYPKASVQTLDREPAPIELGQSEVLHWGRDVMLIACGSMAKTCQSVAARLGEEGLDAGVINARFVKPLDTATILRAIEECPTVVTVEEGVLMGGFGSAVLEAACDAGLDASRVRRLGIPDRYIEHGERAELLADLGLDEPGILAACRRFAAREDIIVGNALRGVPGLPTSDD